jgi:hypothetical protein
VRLLGPIARPRGHHQEVSWAHSPGLSTRLTTKGYS